MSRLEFFDYVALKSDLKLIGHVERTSHDTGYYTPLQDRLVIAYTHVQDELLTSFVRTGVPPTSHVFVEFADQTQGSALVHEDDLELLDRSFNLGDSVKKEGSQMLGTVVNVSERYTLQPVWRNAPNTLPNGSNIIPADDLGMEHVHFCTDACPLPTPNRSLYTYPSRLIANVPAQELKRAADVLDGDYILKNDWLGIVEDIELLVVVMAADGSVAVVHRPEELYIPISNFGDKPLVSLPEYDPDLPRPDVVVAQAGFPAAIPLLPDDYHSGQLVIASKRNLKNARWLRGEYNGLDFQALRVLDVRTNHVGVRWLTCNPFVPSYNHENGEHWPPSPPENKVSLYENLKTFPNRKELRRAKQVTILDQAKNPQGVDDRRRNRTIDSTQTSRPTGPSDIRIGEHVKFRDPAGAAVKYQGVWHEGAYHNRFERIMSDTTLGFDMNEMKIVDSRQSVQVKWQDGTVTEHTSKSLIRHSLFETDLAPADIVVSRDGMLQRLATSPPGPWVEFNEMKFLQAQYDLQPKRVGIIQTVEPTERVASVRWYTNPDLRLVNFGIGIDAESRFGQLDSSVEDVSVYEVMKFPALERRYKDLVILAPAAPETYAVKEVVELEGSNPHLRAITLLSQIPYDFMLHHLRHVARAVVAGQSFEEIRNEKKYKSQPSLDWIGQVVHMGIDGVLTVRVNAGQHYQDVLVEHDQIMCFIDEAAVGEFDDAHDDSSSMSLDSDFEASGDSDLGDSETASAISETIEYEGGKRLDDDSDNENWEDEDEMEQDEPQSSVADHDTVMTDVDSNTVPKSGSTADRSSKMIAESDLRTNNSTSSSQAALKAVPGPVADPEMQSSNNILPLSRIGAPSERPAQFEILSRDPPADQFNANITKAPSTTMLKRIMKEHRILANSLPRGEIFVRTYENRLDLIRCLIIGPRDTPYEHAPFLIDLHLGHSFPREPPTAHFHSWTSGMGRVNPNLYEEGKICLSLLGTWQGRQDTEGWSPDSTLLQLLISLQGLVLVRRPFYNEAGYEEYREQDLYGNESQLYNEKTYIMSRRFVEHVLASPVAGLEDVLGWTYLPHADSPGLAKEVITRSRQLIESSQAISNSDGANGGRLVDGSGSAEDPTKVFLRPLSRGAIVMLERTMKSLETLNDGQHSQSDGASSSEV